MSEGPNRLYKLGGLSFMASGALFLATAVLEHMTGPPPSTGTEILAWMASRQAFLATTPEVFFFAVTLMVPAVIALHDSLVRTHRASAAVGCGIMAVTIPCFQMLIIVFGRLVYPIYHIKAHTPEVAELVVALYYGGLHAVAILLAIATFVLSVAMRHGPYGGIIATLGFATAAFDLIGSYPWAIGPALGLVCSVFFTAWFVAVGFRLYRAPATVLS